MAGGVTALALVGGELALDFANTAGARETDAPVEHLNVPVDFVAWAAHAGIVDGALARRTSATVEDERHGPTILSHALMLREAIHRIGAALARRTTPAPRDLALLQEAARLLLVGAELQRDAAGGFSFDFSRAPPEAALLGPIAWSAVRLLERGGFERLKQCPGHDCGWLFLDRSKNGSRRWCDMATCGNRVKARRARARKV